MPLLVLVAKGAGWLSAWLGQPAVMGELSAGLLLGPTLLNLLHWTPLSSAAAAQTIDHLAEFGVVLLMLIAGLAVDLRDLRSAGRSALLGGVLGVVFPLVGGWGLALLFAYDWPTAFTLGVLLTATSVSISAQTLLELGLLRSREGICLLGAAVVDDVLVILILSALAAFRSGSTNLGGLLLVLGRMVLFLGIGGGFCVWALPRLMRRVERWPVSAAVPSTVLVVTFVMAWAADYLGGVAAITGAFLVGLGLRRSPLHHTIVQAMHTIGYSLFVPLFFLSVGLHANLGGLDIRLLLFALAFILVAAVSKAVGGGLGSWLGGLSLPEAVRVGFGMISRGEVGLIVASVAIRERWFGEELLGVATLMVLTTTLMTPLLVKALFRRRSGGPKRPAGTESPVPDRARGGRRR